MVPTVHVYIYKQVQDRGAERSTERMADNITVVTQSELEHMTP